MLVAMATNTLIRMFWNLTLKLAGYFATHIQAREGGGLVDPPPQEF